MVPAAFFQEHRIPEREAGEEPSRRDRSEKRARRPKAGERTAMGRRERRREEEKE